MVKILYKTYKKNNDNKYIHSVTVYIYSIHCTVIPDKCSLFLCFFCYSIILAKLSYFAKLFVLNFLFLEETILKPFISLKYCCVWVSYAWMAVFTVLCCFCRSSISTFDFFCFQLWNFTVLLFSIIWLSVETYLRSDSYCMCTSCV